MVACGWWLECDGREKKVGFAEKKLRLTQKKWRIVCIKGGMSLPMVTCHNLPPKKSRQGDGIPGLVLA